MRSFKFRYYEKEEERGIGMKYAEPDITDMEYFFGWAYKNETLMQYTGLKDKNGKEIYEGDILKVDINKFIAPEYLHNKDPFNVEVSFDNFHWSCSGGEGKSLYNYTTLSYVELEVIGNKYENPELIGDVNECSR